MTSLPTRLRGYDRATVDRLLAELAERERALQAEHAGFHQDLVRLERERAGAEALEAELRDTLVAAQRETDAQRAAAVAEAERLVEAARASAEEARSGLSARRAEAEAEIERLYALERDFRARAQAVVEQAIARLDADVPVAEAPAHEPPAPEPTAITPLAAAAPLSVEDDTDSIPIFEDPPEYEPTRVAPPAPAPPAPPHAAEEPERPASFLRPFLLSAAIVVAGAGIAIGIWQLASDGKAPRVTTATPVVETMTVPATSPPETEVATAAAPEPATTVETESAPTPPPARTRFAFAAVGGDAWLQIRAGSEDGKLLFEGFLYDGESRRFVVGRVWMRVGDPTSLEVRVNGERVRDLPPGTADFVLAPGGVRNVSLG